jgi:DNA-directed RNA polymerase specialized sigma24 family protein
MLQPMPPTGSSQLAARARSFQHDALTELFDRTVDDVYEYAHALCGDHATAEEVCEAAFRSALDRLPDIQGDGQGLTAAVLALAEEAVRHVPYPRFQGRGIRDPIARLPAAEHEAITLRLVAGLDPELIASATARRTASVLGSEVAALRALRGSPPGLNFAMPAAQRQLDAAIDRLLGGEAPAAAAALAPALAEAGSLLTTAANLVSLPAEPAPPEVRARLRNHFLAGGEERRAHWVHRHHEPAVVPGSHARAHANTLAAGAALVLSGLLAVVAGALLAFAANFSTPSSAMYPLKRADENLLLALTFDRVAKANLEVKLSDERLREAETEAATRHSGKAVQAMSDRFDSLRAAASDLGAVQRHSASWKKTRDYYVQQASEPVDPLNRLLSTNGMKADAEAVARLNEQFQQERKTLEHALGEVNPTQPGAVPSGAPNITPPPPQQ